MQHVAILRELGLLCWVEHGSQRNALRARMGSRFTAGIGYRPTATIYAPCAPPAYDRAKGAIRDGHGYRSRIRCYTPAGRAAAVDDARRRAACRTPSFSTRTPYPPARRGEGTKYSTPRNARATTRPRGRGRGSTGVTAQQAAYGMDRAQRIRLEVWWTQGACLRQLGYALRPLIHAGYGWQEIARELISWQVSLRPTSVVAFIRAGLRRRVHIGLLHLPEGSVPSYRQAPADEAGARYARMTEHRRHLFAVRYGPALARYRATLAEPLRIELRKLASPSKPATPRPQPQLREPERLFRAALGQAAPRDVYRARAYRLPEPDCGPAPASPDEETWAMLAEHAAASAAFQRLREQLASDDRGSAQGSAAW